MDDLVINSISKESDHVAVKNNNNNNCKVACKAQHDSHVFLTTASTTGVTASQVLPTSPALW